MKVTKVMYTHICMYVYIYIDIEVRRDIILWV